MSQVTVRLTDGRRLVVTKFSDELRLTLDGEVLGAMRLEQGWRLAEGIDRTATTVTPTSRRRAPPETPRGRRPGR